MLAVTFRSVGQVEVTSSAPRPALEADTDVLIKTIAAGVCGSDLHPLFGREPCDAHCIFGHEVVGTVVAAGAKATRFPVGTRVVTPFTIACGACAQCNRGLSARCDASRLLGWRLDGVGLHGTQAEYVRIPLADSTLVELPADMHVEDGLLLGDIFSTAVFCAANAGLAGYTGDGSAVAAVAALLEQHAPSQLGDCGSLPLIYVVVGCGPVGLLTIIAARALLALRGIPVVEAVAGGHPTTAAHIFAVDSVPERLAAAQACGATPLNLTAAGSDAGVSAAINAAVGLYGSAGSADAVMECVGAPSAIGLAFHLLRPGGTLSSVGVPTPGAPFPVTPGACYDKNVTYRIGRCPARSMMPHALQLMRRIKAGSISPLAPLDPRALIVSHRFALRDAVEAYRLFSGRLDGCTKAVLYAEDDELAAAVRGSGGGR